jgi:DNA-directed RNA polymerase specialized sigma subunit
MSIVSVRSVREVTNEQYLEAYQQYYPCLCKSSKSWINRYGHDEALHIAGIALWRALQSYDESRRMTFISYLINCIRWSFLDQYGDEDKNLVFGNVGVTDPSYLVPDPDERPEAIKPHLNKTARRIVDLVKAGKSTNEISADMKFSRQRVHQIFGDIRATYNKLCKKGKI